jgi:hypothetical protein
VLSYVALSHLWAGVDQAAVGQMAAWAYDAVASAAAAIVVVDTVGVVAAIAAVDIAVAGVGQKPA